MQKIDTLTAQLERINALAVVLYDLLRDNPHAQIITEIIMETSRRPPKHSAA